MGSSCVRSFFILKKPNWFLHQKQILSIFGRSLTVFKPSIHGAEGGSDGSGRLDLASQLYGLRSGRYQSVQTLDGRGNLDPANAAELWQQLLFYYYFSWRTLRSPCAISFVILFKSALWLWFIHTMHGHENFHSVNSQFGMFKKVGLIGQSE